MPKVSIPLGRAFNGIDRATAPHLLSESDSPATVDVDSGDTVDGIGILTQRNVLGSRLGRKRTYTDASGPPAQNIRGVIPFNFPGTVGYGRVIANAAGVWHPVTTPWPSLTYDPGQIFFQFILTVPASGSNTVFIYADLSKFTAWGINNDNAHVNNLNCLVQALINGVWTTIYDQSTATFPELTVAPFPGTGILTGLRTVNLGLGGGTTARMFALIRGTALSRTPLV